MNIKLDQRSSEMAGSEVSRQCPHRLQAYGTRELHKQLPFVRKGSIRISAHVEGGPFVRRPIDRSGWPATIAVGKASWWEKTRGYLGTYGGSYSIQKAQSCWLGGVKDLNRIFNESAVGYPLVGSWELPGKYS